MTEPKISRAAALGGRGLLGAAVVALGALGLAGAVTLPLPNTQTVSPTVTAAPTPGPLSLVCPGTFVVGGRDATAAQKVLPAADFAMDTAGASASNAASDELTVTDVEGGRMSTLAATPEPGGTVDLAGTASTTVDAEDASGFAAAACRPALTESWIAGVDTAVGTSGVLMLSNPGDVEATVRVTVYGEAGPNVPAGAQSIVVPARTTVPVAVAAVAGSEPAPVLLVQSAGAPVQASLQSSTVRGLVPTGIDAQTAAAGAAARQVIPGVVVGKPGAGATTRVRVLSPDSAQSAEVLLTPVGKSQPAVRVPVQLERGIPVDLPLDDVAAGTYDAVIEGRGPLVASLWQATGTKAGSDDAWFGPAPALTEASTAAVTGGAPASLYLSNPGTDAITVAVTVGGKSRDVKIAPRSSAALEAPVGAVTVDPGGATVHASITYSSPKALGATTVWAPDVAAAAVTVTR